LKQSGKKRPSILSPWMLPRKKFGRQFTSTGLQGAAVARRPKAKDKQIASAERIAWYDHQWVRL